LSEKQRAPGGKVRPVAADGAIIGVVVYGDGGGI